MRFPSVPCLGLAALTLFGFAGCDDEDSGGSPSRGGRSQGGAAGKSGADERGGETTDAAGAGIGGEAGALRGTAGAPGGGAQSTGGAGAGGGSGPESGGAVSEGGSSGSESGGAGAGGSGGAAGAVTLSEVSTFSVNSKFCGVAYDSAESVLWLYTCSSASIESYSTDGTPLGSVEAPGETADDADVDVTSVALTLGETEVPANTLLFINGESGVAEIYAVDSEADSVLATLTTEFGASHVVGGAYHAERGTFFAVQDRVPAAANANRFAEISSETGAAPSVFSTLPNFDVNYGDLDVCPSSGNLFLVSSQESGIAEFSPDGAFIAKYPLPAGITSLSGLAIDDATGDAWVSSTSGKVSRITGLPCE